MSFWRENFYNTSIVRPLPAALFLKSMLVRTRKQQSSASPRHPGAPQEGAVAQLPKGR